MGQGSGVGCARPLVSGGEMEPSLGRVGLWGVESLTGRAGAADAGRVTARGGRLAAGATSHRGHWLIAAIEVPEGDAGVEDVKNRDFNLDWEARRQAQRDEVPELGKKCVADSHEVNDGSHLLTQGQGVLLTQPQLGLEPGPPDPKG